MPIDYKQYHPNFRKRAKRCIERAGYQCQHCLRKQGEEYVSKSGQKQQVALQAHHPNRDPMNGRAVLVALCVQCHLEEDKWYRAKKATSTKYRKKREAEISSGQLELPFYQKKARFAKKAPFKQRRKNRS